MIVMLKTLGALLARLMVQVASAFLASPFCVGRPRVSLSVVDDSPANNA